MQYILDKKGKPFAFFSLLHKGRHRADLGAMYVKKKFRGLLGSDKKLAGKGHFKGTGQRLVEFAMRVSRKMGHDSMLIPEVSGGMNRAFSLVNKTEPTKSYIKSYRRTNDGEGAGDDIWVKLNKPP